MSGQVYDIRALGARRRCPVSILRADASLIADMQSVYMICISGSV
jgi:hypothetical protein